MFITFEGGEGSGKSTQIVRLLAWFETQGIPFLATREPGGTIIAEKIRQIFNANQGETMDPISEALLIYAARKQHLDKKVRPALAEGKAVVCDRFFDSSWVYQGVQGNVPADVLEFLDRLVIGDLTPDLTFLIDCDPEVSIKRVSDRGDKSRFDLQGEKFYATIRQGFLSRAALFPARIKKFNSSNLSVDTLSCQIIKEIEARFFRDHRP